MEQYKHNIYKHINVNHSLQQHTSQYKPFTSITYITI